jgi:hypothetical protein
MPARRSRRNVDRERRTISAERQFWRAPKDTGTWVVVCDPPDVIFGASLRAAASTNAAAWIVGSRWGQSGTVGGLIPNMYESTLRLHAPDPTPHGWWEMYRDLFDLVASVGARYTSTPNLAWFAIWEGHGFGTGTTLRGWRDPPDDDAERQRRDAERERQGDADRERNARIGPALADVPRFDLPDRSYYLTYGPLSATTELRYPDDVGWRNPDLFWPNDRSWFAATDVDFWSLYVGGSRAFTSDLATRSPTLSEFVDNDDRLPTED